MSSYFDDKELFVGPQTHQYGSHMVTTDVKKPIQTKYINVDTRFRDDYNNNFTIDYNLTLDDRTNDLKSIYVTNLELPISFYNISEALGNNVFKVDTTIITVPDGNYDASTLATTIDGLLPPSGSFAIANNKATITGTFDVYFNVDKYGNFDRYNLKSSLGWLLGFREPQYTVTTSQITEGLVNLNGPKYLYLTIDEFNSKVNRNTLTRIQLDNTSYPFGTVLPASVANGYLESELRTYSGKNDLLKIHVRLINEFGKVMDLNGEDISFVLKVEYV